MIFSKESACSYCDGELIYRGSVPRLTKSKAGSKNWIELDTYKCTRCGSVHRLLPDFLMPYKHYTRDVIDGVLNGYISEETLGYEDYPTELTMKRWRSSLLVQ